MKGYKDYSVAFAQSLILKTPPPLRATRKGRKRKLVRGCSVHGGRRWQQRESIQNRPHADNVVLDRGPRMALELITVKQSPAPGFDADETPARAGRRGRYSRRLQPACAKTSG
ncbi:MAG: hypothetical protein KAV82_14660 [Phycisphaerae bacterium]|nr:hypothetical protein [Phycisphaerae bacterium]